MSVKTAMTLRNSDSEGFGLVEVLVAMLLLSALSLAVLPVLIQGLRQSTSNVTLASATQLVEKRIDLANAAGSSCASVVAALATLPTDESDSRGVRLTITQSSIVCPTATPTHPATVSLTVKAVRQGTTASVAEATTLIYVDGP